MQNKCKIEVGVNDAVSLSSSENTINAIANIGDMISDDVAIVGNG